MATWRELPPEQWETYRLRPGERVQLYVHGVPYDADLFDRALVELTRTHSAEGWQGIAWGWKDGELSLVVEALEPPQLAAPSAYGGQTVGWPLVAVTVIVVAGAVIAWLQREAISDITASVDRVLVFAENEWTDVRALLWAGVAVSVLTIGYLYVRRFT